MATQNQNALLALLGSEYSLKEIDYEMCIYRKLNSHYDIEISGTSRKRHPFCVFVWDISRSEGLGSTIVEQHFDIKGEDALVQLLTDLAHKYQNLA